MERYKKMLHLLKSVCDYENDMEIQSLAATTHLKHLFAAMIRNCDSRSDLTFRDRWSFQKKMFRNPYNQMAIKLAKSNDKVSRIYSTVLKTKSVVLNMLFARTAYVVQRKLNKLFEYIK